GAKIAKHGRRLHSSILENNGLDDIIVIVQAHAAEPGPMGDVDRADMAERDGHPSNGGDDYLAELADFGIFSKSDEADRLAALAGQIDRRIAPRTQKAQSPNIEVLRPQPPDVAAH